MFDQRISSNYINFFRKDINTHKLNKFEHFFIHFLHYFFTHRFFFIDIALNIHCRWPSNYSSRATEYNIWNIVYFFFFY